MRKRSKARRGRVRKRYLGMMQHQGGCASARMAFLVACKNEFPLYDQNAMYYGPSGPVGTKSA